MTIQSRIPAYFAAGVPGVSILTVEEERVLLDLESCSAKMTREGRPAKVYTWSVVEGLRSGDSVEPKTSDPVGACRFLRESKYPEWAANGGGVVLWRDLGALPLNGPGANPILCRHLRELLTEAKAVGALHVFVGPRFDPAPEWARLVREVPYALPGRDAREAILDSILASAREAYGDKVSPDAAGREKLLRAMGGLTSVEGEDALAVALAESGWLDPEVVFREKVSCLKVGGAIDVRKPLKGGLDRIGGLEALKSWLLKRRSGWDKDAIKYGVRPPKGIVLVGVPGTGKSFTAMAVATAYDLLYVRLDLGRVYASLVGQTEQNLRAALDAVDALSPCVLHIDEVEKAFAGFGGGGGGDSGVSRRAGGKLLEWLGEQTSAFVVATSNDITAVPPEFTRAGRFDALFGLDLPNAQEREAILALKLSERGRLHVVGSILSPVVDATEGYTGAELEVVVDEAITTAWDAGDRDSASIPQEYLIKAAAEVKPQCETQKEAIDAIRAWTRTRAKSASGPQPVIAKRPSAGRRMAALKP